MTRALIVPIAAIAILFTPAIVSAQSSGASGSASGPSAGSSSAVGSPSAGSAGAGTAGVNGIPPGPGSGTGINNSVNDPSGVGNSSKLNPSWVPTARGLPIRRAPRQRRGLPQTREQALPRALVQRRAPRPPRGGKHPAMRRFRRKIRLSTARSRASVADADRRSSHQATREA
jgi:hypothetical protein